MRDRGASWLAAQLGQASARSQAEAHLMAMAEAASAARYWHAQGQPARAAAALEMAMRAGVRARSGLAPTPTPEKEHAMHEIDLCKGLTDEAEDPRFKPDLVKGGPDGQPAPDGEDEDEPAAE